MTSNVKKVDTDEVIHFIQWSGEHKKWKQAFNSIYLIHAQHTEGGAEPAHVEMLTLHSKHVCKQIIFIVYMFLKNTRLAHSCKNVRPSRQTSFCKVICHIYHICVIQYDSTVYFMFYFSCLVCRPQCSLTYSYGPQGKKTSIPDLAFCQGFNLSYNHSLCSTPLLFAKHPYRHMVQPGPQLSATDRPDNVRLSLDLVKTKFRFLCDGCLGITIL